MQLQPLGKLLLQAAGVAGYAALVRAYYRVETAEDELLWATTGDGWRLALSRYLPRGSYDRQHPLLLCPGLSANRIGFDLAPPVSLARHLSGLGWDTWVLELRGHGRSDRPRPFGRGYGWSFDDHLRRDAPAAIERVLGETGRDALHWVGHSMGGSLLYALLATGERRLRSAVTVGSSLAYDGTASDFHALRQALPLARTLPAVPFGPAALLGAPATARLPTRLDEFNVWPSNVEPELVRRLHACAFHAVSSPVLLQLATAMEPGGLRSLDGRVRYLDGLREATTPVLALAGDRDRQCAPAAARGTLEALGARGRRLVVLGREQGQADHYGHFDLLIGRRAPRESWPHIAAWLAEHDR